MLEELKNKLEEFENTFREQNSTKAAQEEFAQHQMEKSLKDFTNSQKETENKLLTLSDKPRAATALTISCQRARLNGLLGLIARRQYIEDAVRICINPLRWRVSRYDVGVPNQAYSST